MCTVLPAAGGIIGTDVFFKEFFYVAKMATIDPKIQQK
jgi:hypothetical protein